MNKETSKKQMRTTLTTDDKVNIIKLIEKETSYAYYAISYKCT